MSIPEYAFCGCKSLTSIILPNGVQSIGNQAFGDCVSLSSIVIPSSVTDITMGAFMNCNLKTAGPIGGGYSIEYGWTDEIPEYAFYDCRSLESVVISNGIKKIKRDAFNYCISLSSVVVSNSVNLIDFMAFAHCSSLVTIIIPNSVNSIKTKAFYECLLLTIYCECETIPDGWENNWNNNCQVVWGFKIDE